MPVGPENSIRFLWRNNCLQVKIGEPAVTFSPTPKFAATAFSTPTEGLAMLRRLLFVPTVCLIALLALPHFASAQDIAN